MAAAEISASGLWDALIPLLRPQAVLSKTVAGGGRWSVRKPPYGDPAFCLMLEGACILEPDGLDGVDLHAGDFLLMPRMPGFTLSATRGIEPTVVPLDYARLTRHGDEGAPVTMRMLGGYFRFDPAHAALLVSLLPTLVVVRRDEPGSDRLSRIIGLIAEEEAHGDSGSSTAILERLVEVLLIEAMRANTPVPADRQRGLVAALADPVLAPALHALHADIAYGWTVEGLAGAASTSRAAFARRFTETVGMTPMHYLLEWRLALAKDLLRSGTLSTAQIAARVGYRSAPAFTTAFARATGCSPTEFARRYSIA